MSDRYRKIRPGEPSYEMVEARKQAGLWVCDAYTHNSNQGCSNPECFKFSPKRTRKKKA